MTINFSRRKTWWFYNHKKHVSIEICGWKSNASISVAADGDEGDVTFHLALFFGTWITFSGFIPNKWYPTYISSYSGNPISDERRFSIAFHNGSLWWDFWTSEEHTSWTKNKSWRKGCFHIVDRIRGKHEYHTKELDRREFLLPFIEGNYNVQVIKMERTDSWKRWPKRKMICFDINAGYYLNGEWVDTGVPVEGKGESSWDQDEDATFSMYFPGHPIHKGVFSPYDAALYFWHSMMKSRERYGSARWVPEKFKDKERFVIKDPPRKKSSDKNVDGSAANVAEQD